MRILNEAKDQVLDSIFLLLTIDEARELEGKLTDLIVRTSERYHHTHISDKEYKHEITITIYTDENMNEYSERLKRLIINDS